MKKLLILFLVFFYSCSVNIPSSTYLKDNIIEDKNVQVKYTISSDIKDGIIEYYNEDLNIIKKYKYNVESNFNSIWKEYFNKKYNKYSKDIIFINVNQIDFFIIESKKFIGVYSKININIKYNDLIYNDIFEISSNDNEFVVIYNDGIYYRIIKYSPEQKSKLIDDCFNNSILIIDKHIDNILKNN